MSIPSILVALAVCAAAPGSAPPSKAVRSSSAKLQVMSQPLSFEPNVGQFDSRVRFKTSAGGSAVFITNSEAVMVLPGKPIAGKARGPRGRTPIARGPGAVLRMKLVGSLRSPVASGASKLPGVANYFIGNDPKKWRTKVPTYRQARFAGVYPGTDLVYYGNPSRLEYDFVLKPGADPKRIKLAFAGAKTLRVARNGDLIAATSVGDVCWKRPFAYQLQGGRRVQVACDYDVAPGAAGVGFRLARYDATRLLVVDPSLAYSTYLGGSDDDSILGLAVDSSEAAYAVGYTVSSDFPTTAGAVQKTHNGLFDVIVSKLNATGTALEYSTFLGGTANDVGSAIAVDSNGAAYVTGYTNSSGYLNFRFPTTVGAYQPDVVGGTDAFVSKLSATGGLTFSTCFGGTDNDAGSAIAVASDGEVTVAGSTNSVDLPTTSGAAQTRIGGIDDGFVARFNTTLSGRSYATYLGGAEYDYATGVAVYPDGSAYVTGFTSSANFPTTSGAYQRTLASAGDYDAFVTKLNSSGTGYVYSTLVGGNHTDEAYGIVVDAEGAASITGCTGSTNFPTSVGAVQITCRGKLDAFITRLSVDGASLAFSTYLGGAGDDCGMGVSLGLANSAWIVGYTYSLNFPTTNRAYQGRRMDPADAFFAGVNRDGTKLAYSTYFGGSNYYGGPGNDRALAVAISNIAGAPSTSRLFMGGYTESADLPLSSGPDLPYQSSLASPADAFITRFELAAPTTLTVPDVMGHAGDTVEITATLTTPSMSPGQPPEPLVGETVTFTVGGNAVPPPPFLPPTTGPLGVARTYYTIPAHEPAGVLEIVATFADQPIYSGCTGRGKLGVDMYPTTLTVEDAIGRRGETAIIRAQLTSNGAPLGGKDITFTLKDSAGAETVHGPVKTDVFGFATLELPIAAAAPLGAYTVTAEFVQDAVYLGSTGTGTLDVREPVKTTRVYVAPKIAASGGTVNLTAELFDVTVSGLKLAAKTLNFAIDGVPVGSAVTTDIGGGGVPATLPFNTAGLAEGVHEIVVSFDGDIDFAGSNGTDLLTITKIPTRVTASNRIVTMGSTVTLRGVLSRLGGYVAGETLTFRLDDVEIGSATTNASGLAAIDYTAYDTIGSHSLVTSFAGNATYLPSSTTNTVTIDSLGTRIYVAPKATAIADRVVLSATLFYGSTKLASKRISFAIDGTTIGSGVTGATGVATLSYQVLDALGVGEHVIGATFDGDAQYAASADTGTLVVSKAVTRLDVRAAEVLRQGSTTLWAQLVRIGGYVVNKPVTFSVDGVAVGTANTNASGIATLTFSPGALIPAPLAGTYALTASFAGDATNEASSGASTVVIKRDASTLFVSSLTREIYQATNLAAQIRSVALGTRLANKTITFSVDGVVVGSAVSDPLRADVAAILAYAVPDTLTVGNHTITADFAGDADYLPSTNTGTLNVTTATSRLAAAAVSVRAGRSTSLTATLTSSGGSAVGRTVAFTVNGAAVGSATTDATGRAVLAYTASLPAGSYSIVASFAGDAVLKPASGGATLTVTP